MEELRFSLRTREAGGQGGDDAVRLIECVEGECRAGFALAMCAMAGVDD